MEDDYNIQAPYYEMAYFDDTNTQHLAKIRDTEVVRFLEDRYKVTDCTFVQD